LTHRNNRLALKCSQRVTKINLHWSQGL